MARATNAQPAKQPTTNFRAGATVFPGQMKIASTPIAIPNMTAAANAVRIHLLLADLRSTVNPFTLRLQGHSELSKSTGQLVARGE